MWGSSLVVLHCIRWEELPMSFLMPVEMVWRTLQMMHCTLLTIFLTFVLVEKELPYYQPHLVILPSAVETSLNEEIKEVPAMLIRSSLNLTLTGYCMVKTTEQH